MSAGMISIHKSRNERQRHLFFWGELTSNTSRFTSSPTKKKKTAIRPSFTHNNNGLASKASKGNLYGDMQKWSIKIS